MSFGAWSAIRWTIRICSPMGANFSTRTSYRCAASQNGLLGRGSELLASRVQAVTPSVRSNAATSMGAASMARHCGRAHPGVNSGRLAEQRGVAWSDEVVPRQVRTPGSSTRRGTAPEPASTSTPTPCSTR